MYKFSKISILVLYPLVSLVLPLMTFGVLGTQLASGTSSSGSVSTLLNVNTLATIALLVLAIYYGYRTYKMQLFKKGDDGKNKATVSDYFAAAFTVFIIGGVLSNLLKLIA